MSESPTIIYTFTDEAPALATRSLFPFIQAFTRQAGISVETRDISLASRILATFSDSLTEEQRVHDALAELGALTQSPEANIIKLPNVSASAPQLIRAIEELQAKGYSLPHYPEEPQSDEEKEIRSRYDKIKGSAVNPVLRQGNSDRRAPRAVKEYARNHPHSMGPWTADSKTRVATMDKGDFFANEKSMTVPEATDVTIEFVGDDGATTVLKKSMPLLAGEIIDGTVMSKKALLAFLEEQVAAAKREGVLFSIHMKATMMKVSDPVIFGHAVRVYFKDLIAKHGVLLEQLGVDFNNGFADLVSHLDELPADQKAEVEADIQACYENGPDLAMVNSDKGITNLHVPSDVIVDASMPAMIRNSGQMWDADGKQRDTLAVIPDSSYACIYQATIDFCKANGAFDPTTMGTVSNVGLMAQKAEEYGSHDKTFEIHGNGHVRVVDAAGKTLMEHRVEDGDIWRMCQAKDEPIRDWIKLAVKRARATDTPAVFWLDIERAHDEQVIGKVHQYLPENDSDDLEFYVLSPLEAALYTLVRLKDGLDTISVTGNVLRDYLTDLFPILEVGTSAKMLSIVPLMKGGGMFETGAGGSAPKHVQQFVAENHLRWDSLGEFLALTVSLEHLAEKYENSRARILSQTLDDATTKFLMNNKSPSRKAGELDNRGSHVYLALYWAEALADQDEDTALKTCFRPIAKDLGDKVETIIAELNEIQGSPVDMGGYYLPDETKTTGAMRPCAALNAIVDGI